MATIVIFLVLIAVLWFVMIRPQQRRQRDAQQMQAELVPGANVMLTSGIFGVVHEITDDYILVEIAEGATIKVVRAAIGRVLPEDFGQPSTDDAAAEADPTIEPADGAITDHAHGLDGVSDVEHSEPEEDR